MLWIRYQVLSKSVNYAKLERLSGKNLYNLLGPFISYEENEMWIRSQILVIGLQGANTVVYWAHSQVTKKLNCYKYGLRSFTENSGYPWTARLPTSVSVLRLCPGVLVRNCRIRRATKRSWSSWWSSTSCRRSCSTGGNSTPPSQRLETKASKVSAVNS
jgi:hypothetical protein